MNEKERTMPQASIPPTKGENNFLERAIEKLQQAISGNMPVSKNNLIKEAIKILKG